MVKKKLDMIDAKVYSKIKIKEEYTKIMNYITNLANIKLLILISLLVLIILENKTIGILVITNLVFTIILIGLIKNIFKRPRPNINRLVDEKGYSYASGHTICATSFYGFIMFSILISPLFLPLKLILLLIFSFIVVLIGFSRIYLGVHYFSDVVGGYLIANSYLLLYIYIINNILNLI